MYVQHKWPIVVLFLLYIQSKFREQFITDPIQGGAGTSINMNVNEVISNRDIEFLGEEKENYNIL